MPRGTSVSVKHYVSLILACVQAWQGCAAPPDGRPPLARCQHHRCALPALSIPTGHPCSRAAEVSLAVVGRCWSLPYWANRSRQGCGTDRGLSPVRTPKQASSRSWATTRTAASAWRPSMTWPSTAARTACAWTAPSGCARSTRSRRCAPSAATSSRASGTSGRTRSERAAAAGIIPGWLRAAVLRADAAVPGDASDKPGLPTGAPTPGKLCVACSPAQAFFSSKPDLGASPGTTHCLAAFDAVTGTG